MFEKNVLYASDSFTFCCHLLGCFTHCRLIPKDAIPHGLTDSVRSEDVTCCDSPPLEAGCGFLSLDSIVAYGLGHFSTCPIARFQFALLLLLSDIVKVNDCYLHT